MTKNPKECETCEHRLKAIVGECEGCAYSDRIEMVEYLKDMIKKSQITLDALKKLDIAEFIKDFPKNKDGSYCKRKSIRKEIGNIRSAILFSWNGETVRMRWSVVLT